MMRRQPCSHVFATSDSLTAVTPLRPRPDIAQSSCALVDEVLPLLRPVLCDRHGVEGAPL